MAKRKQKKSAWNYLAELLVKLAVFAAAVWAIFTFVLGWMRVGGNNMFPMIKSGDFCLYYRLDRAYIDDPVIYDPGDGTLRIGRVAAIENQTVNFSEGGGYTVDDSIPAEYLPYETHEDENKAVKYPLTLAPDQYFILNDYRSDTYDSRQLGAIDISSIKGKAIFIFRRRSV